MKRAQFASKTFLGLWLALLTGLTAPIAAQEVSLWLDYASYRRSDEALLLEIYYSFDAGRLQAGKADTSGMREAVIDLRIWRQDSLWVSDAWRMQSSSPQSGPNQIENRMVDVLRYEAPPGRYRVQISVKDMASQIAQTARKEFTLERISSRALAISEIELATMIRKEEPDVKRPALYKNQMLVVPQPDGVYSPERPMLFYYFEIYNLLANAPGENYKIKCYVADSSGRAISQVRGRTMIKPKSMNASVEVGSLHLGSLMAGRYWLSTEVLSAADQVLDKKTKPFAMLAAASMPDAAANSPGPMPVELVQPYAAMSEAQVATAYKQAAYFMTLEQKQVYEQMSSLDAKKRFLAEFWWLQDPTPATPTNEFYLKVQQRIEYANKNYRSFAREGWQTDRGRVYILYGEPSDTDFFPSTESNRPYERWVYNDIEGGVEFIFIDRTGFKEYRLVHSTKTGEIKDPDWLKQLRN
jgi:GWxTD domain-containing protein